MLWQNGINRPMTMGIQWHLVIETDGFYGEETEENVQIYQQTRGLKPEDCDGVVGKQTLDLMVAEEMKPEFRILELISCFEVGMETHNAWAATSTIKDNMGKNWGVMQVNGPGKEGSSYETMKNRYMPRGEDFDDWIGSPNGAKAQGQYFLDLIYPKAVAFAEKIGDSSLRTVAMLCDAIVQGGSTYMRQPPLSYAYWRLGDEALDKVVYNFNSMKVKDALVKKVTDYSEPGKMFAELHPRSGNPDFLKDQLSRRRAVIDGVGNIHGTKYFMEEFGL
jgi:hypothetical protein